MKYGIYKEKKSEEKDWGYHKENFPQRNASCSKLVTFHGEKLTNVNLQLFLTLTFGYYCLWHEVLSLSLSGEKESWIQEDRFFTFIPTEKSPCFKNKVCHFQKMKKEPWNHKDSLSLSDKKESCIREDSLSLSDKKKSPVFGKTVCHFEAKKSPVFEKTVCHFQPKKRVLYLRRQFVTLKHTKSPVFEKTVCHFEAKKESCIGEDSLSLSDQKKESCIREDSLSL